MALLLPFITISSCTVELLEVIDLNQVEQSIEESYAEKKFSNVASKVATVCKNSTGMENDPKMAISLNSVNQNLLIQQMHESLLKNDCAEPVKMSWRWCRQNMTSFLDTIFIRDNMRMLICTMIYYLSISLFRLIQSMTSPERLKKSLQNNGQCWLFISNWFWNNFFHFQIELTNTSSLVNIAKGFDISGHVFILIFSILIILEECAIMTGWEPLGDRLHSLSMEYTNIHLTSMAPNSICSVGRPFCNDLATNKRLFSSWVRYNCHKNQIRVLFILITLLLIVWDFMLTQTAFFYHTFAEKILALIWAYSSWYFTYRFLFPLLHLQVRRVNQWKNNFISWLRTKFWKRFWNKNNFFPSMPVLNGLFCLIIRIID